MVISKRIKRRILGEKVGGASVLIKVTCKRPACVHACVRACVGLCVGLCVFVCHQHVKSRD